MTVEYRAAPNAPATDNGHIAGYAAMFNKRSRNMGFIEYVAPSAFDSMAEAGWPNVICRMDHRPDALLGTTQAGTLKLAITGEGLYYDVDVADTSAGRDCLSLTGRGDIQHSSFAFRVPENGDEWARDNSGVIRRTLLGVELIDVAPCNSPAYESTSASVRDIDGAVESLSRKFSAEPAELRSLMENGKLVKLFKLTARYDRLVARQKANALELKRHDLTAGE